MALTTVKPQNLTQEHFEQLVQLHTYTNEILHFPTEVYIISADITVPNNLLVSVDFGTRIYINEGVTLTLNCPVAAPDGATIFYGPGALAGNFGGAKKEEEWVSGSIGDTSTAVETVGRVPSTVIVVDAPYSMDATGENAIDAVLSTAVNSFGSNGGTIVFPQGEYLLEDDITIPSNVTLQMLSGAVISIAGDKTLTINGNFEGGNYQVFSCGAESTDGSTTGNITAGDATIVNVADESVIDVGSYVSISGEARRFQVTESEPGQLTLNAAVYSTDTAVSIIQLVPRGKVLWGNGSVNSVSTAWFGTVADAAAALGTLSGVTGDSNSTSDIITNVSDTTDIVAGQSIKLAGETYPFRVQTVTVDTVQVDRAPSNTAAGVAITGYTGHITYTGTDNADAIQDAIDSVQNGRTNDVYLPAGKYRITKSIQVRDNRLDGNYCNIHFRGAGGDETGVAGSHIFVDGGDIVGINIQGARGVKVTDLSISGKNYRVWADNLNGASYADNTSLTGVSLLHQSDPEDWCVSGVSTSRTGAHTGIAIDSHYASAVLQPSPYFSDRHYASSLSQNVVIEDCLIRGFYAGMVISLAGGAQGDTIRIGRNNVSYSVFGVCSGNDQTRTCDVYHNLFTRLHTAIDNVSFGSENGGALLNLRSNQHVGVQRLYAMAPERNGQCSIDGEYAEFCGYIGQFGISPGQNSGAIAISGCQFDFVQYFPRVISTTGTVVFSGCRFLLGSSEYSYNDFLFPFTANEGAHFTFRNCFFNCKSTNNIGGIYVNGYAPHTVTVEDCSFIDGSLDVYAYEMSDVTRLTDNTGSAQRKYLPSDTSYRLLIGSPSNSLERDYKLEHTLARAYKTSWLSAAEVDGYTFDITFAGSWQNPLLVGDVVACKATHPDPDAGVDNTPIIPVYVVTASSGASATIQIPEELRNQCSIVAGALTQPVLYYKHFCVINGEIRGTKTNGSASITSVTNADLLEVGDLVAVEGEAQYAGFRVVGISGTTVTLHAAVANSGSAWLANTRAVDLPTDGYSGEILVDGSALTILDGVITNVT